jgi:hypothetical protein
LEHTSWFGRQVEREVVERTEHDWYDVWSDGRTWVAVCGPRNLAEVLERFRPFIGPPVADDRRETQPPPLDVGYPRIRYVPPEP